MDRSDMRVVALADSLALPRSDGGETVRWEETWPSVLQASLREVRPGAEVVNCGQRSRTADSLSGEDFVEHVLLKAPSVVIVQVGIVDCAPRVFSRREKRVLRSRFMPETLRRWLIGRRRGARRALVARDPLRKVYTKPQEFAGHLEEFTRRTGELERPPRLIVIPILGCQEVLDAKSPGFARNIEIYNAILRTACHRSGAVWVGVEASEGELPGSDLFCADGYHLAPGGNRALATVLTRIVLDLSR